ncbi:MobA/MobL family protein [Bradyrhizobium pachyrhizi]|uniref:MobA/MobL family protein n=1 Tax=Bradyrhizobium pachyrhizi TaxID=280333 RepID=UPI00067BBB85|nr:MobA/MobL family protein [Bradyrhizobium pachyrhizi]
MAIFSLHHSPIGKSTQAQPYTAAAHINYITRKRAMSLMQKARLPGQNPREVAEYLKACEDKDRKNARVIDKVMLALPKELNQTERIGLVREFAEHVTQGRAPWLAAFHDKGKDANNPHCHLVLRDRDPKTGKRVIGTSEIGSTERLRESWEKFANRALERAGRSERIDRRTLADQGIEREPTIHEGPQSQAMDKRGAQPRSQRRRLPNRPGSKRRHRHVDYRLIDKGKSRPQENRARRAASQETERDYWAAIDRDSQARELQNLASIHNPHREPAALRTAPTLRPSNQPGKASRHVPRQASVKPSEKLAKQKPRFKDLSTDGRKRDRGRRIEHGTSPHPAKPPKPKWNARDQRALERMRRERQDDRSRDR